MTDFKKEGGFNSKRKLLAALALVVTVCEYTVLSYFFTLNSNPTISGYFLSHKLVPMTKKTFSKKETTTSEPQAVTSNSIIISEATSGNIVYVSL